MKNRSSLVYYWLLHSLAQNAVSKHFLFSNKKSGLTNGRHDSLSAHLGRFYNCTVPVRMVVVVGATVLPFSSVLVFPKKNWGEKREATGRVGERERREV